MAPRVRKNREEDPENDIHQLRLSNVEGKGLGYYDKDSQLILVSKVSLKLIGSAFSRKYKIKANIWGAKYHGADDDRKIWRVLVPKKVQLNYRDFELFIDQQTGEDSAFKTSTKPKLWRGFIQHQEELLEQRTQTTKFTIAENTGLLDTVLKVGDRSTERYVFDHFTMYNSEGKKLTPIDVVFHPSLSTNVKAFPVLKPMSFKKGGRDVFSNIIKVSTPGDNFYACQLALGAGFTLFHGTLVRSVTCGQLPVVSGKISKIFYI